MTAVLLLLLALAPALEPPDLVAQAMELRGQGDLAEALATLGEALDLEASDATDGEREVAERILSELYDKDQQAYDELIASFEGRRLAPAPEMLQLFLLGMALCFLRQRSGGLTIPVLAHFAVTAFTGLGSSLI